MPASKPRSTAQSNRQQEQIPTIWQRQRNVLLIFVVVLVVVKIVSFLVTAHTYCETEGGSWCPNGHNKIPIIDPNVPGGQKLASQSESPSTCRWEEAPQTGCMVCTCVTTAARTPSAGDTANDSAHTTQEATENVEGTPTTDSTGTWTRPQSPRDECPVCTKPCNCEVEGTLVRIPNSSSQNASADGMPKRPQDQIGSLLWGPRARQRVQARRPPGAM
jgi:hypothetical protein